MPIRRALLALVVPAVVLATLSATATPARAAAPTRLVSLTVTPASVNTTAAEARVTVRARATDPEGIAAFGVQAIHQATTTVPYTGFWDAYPSADRQSIAIPRVSGSATDGVYEGQLLVPRSANGGLELYVSVVDTTDAVTSFDPAGLRALGVTDRFSAVSTQLPPKLGNLKGRSLTGTGTVGGFPVITRTGVVTYTIGTGGYHRGIQVVSQNGCAGSSLISQYYDGTGTITWSGRSYTPCVIKLRTYNGLGYGPTSTLTFI